MPDGRAGGGYRTSILGRVDWACWLAVLGLIFLTVVSVLVQFAVLGVVAMVIAVGLVAFDSWVNRPRGRVATSSGRRDTGWQTGADTGGWDDDEFDSGVDVPARPAPPSRAPDRSGLSQDPRLAGFRPAQPPQQQPPQRQRQPPPGQQRPAPGQQGRVQPPPRQPQRPVPGQQLPPTRQQPQGQPTRQQPQPTRQQPPRPPAPGQQGPGAQPYRPAPPEQGRDDYRARR